MIERHEITSMTNPNWDVSTEERGIFGNSGYSTTTTMSSNWYLKINTL